MVYFRNRIGEEGIDLIFKESIRINDKDGKQDEGTADTAVQEKNITYPTKNKLRRKIKNKCVAIAEQQQLELKQSYRCTIKKQALQQRFHLHPKNYRKARKAVKEQLQTKGSYRTQDRSPQSRLLLKP